MTPPRNPERPASLSIVDLLQKGRTLRSATAALMIANVIVFVLLLINGAGLWHSPNGVQLAWGASFGPATKDGEWYRLATAMFLHFGLLHLAMNMWALWDVGRMVEGLYGWRRMVFLYFASGVSGNLLSLLAHGDHAVSGGASGAVFGMYGAFLVATWLRRAVVDAGEFRIMFWGAAAFAAATLAFGFLVPGIDNAAHAGGLVSGALLAGTVPPRGLQARLRGLRVAYGATYLALMIAIAASIPAPAYRWQDELAVRRTLQEFVGDDQRIGRQWESILVWGRRSDRTFEQMADRIESEISTEYLETFENLSSVHIDPAAPSAQQLERAKAYARVRGEAARALAEGLRLHDRQRIEGALEKARNAQAISEEGTASAPLPSTTAPKAVAAPRPETAQK